MMTFAARRGATKLKRIGRQALGRPLRALGFTLIEMAIVLVVIGLIVSGGLVAVAPVIENSKINESNQKLDRIEQALIVHVIRNGCLPCPAVPDTASNATNVGWAFHTSAYSTGCASATCSTFSGANQGVVPWVNLGLSEADATDAFGARVSYAVTAALTQTASGTTTGMQRVTSSYPAGTLVVNNNASTPQQLTSEAAYVLISHGPDRAGAFRASVGGTAIPATAYSSAAQTANTNGTPFVQDDAVTDKDTTADVYFDDLVRWRTAPMIIQQCGANSCGNPL